MREDPGARMWLKMRVQCVCCNGDIWITPDRLPLCDRCGQAREPFREEIERLRAEVERLENELARFHPCKPLKFPDEEDITDGGCYDYTSEEVHGRAVWHKED